MCTCTDKLDDVDLGALSDHDLLAGAASDLAAENAAAARRLARIEMFRQRREADQLARGRKDAYFTLRPVAETEVEAGPLLGHNRGKIRADLKRVRDLQTHFPEIWHLCRSGQLDIYKASIISEAAEYKLDDAGEIEKLHQAMATWLLHSIAQGEPDHPLITKTAKQLRNRLNYVMARLNQKGENERFKRSFKDRHVQLQDADSGMGYLTVHHTMPNLLAANQHLTLIAKALRQAGDERTVAQLKADTMLDLILGKAVVNPNDPRLGDGEHTDVDHPLVRRLPIPNHARPVVNVTVPIQTLMGISDEPGVLSGDTTIPATLARLIAEDPNSTWYRMLTDPRRKLAELSTKSYQPTAPIWREVVAKFNTCFHPACSTPATACETDHTKPFPEGETSTGNLEPACKGDHKAKHAEGFRLRREADGSLTFKTRAGFVHRSEETEQPTSEEWPADHLFESQFSATEIVDAIVFLDEQRQARNHAAHMRHVAEKGWVDYEASYPEATEEAIYEWIHGVPGQPEEAHFVPPIIKRGITGLQAMQSHEVHLEHCRSD